MKRTREQKLLDPKPGSRIAAARDFGIDMTLLVENLRLSPDERLLKVQQAMVGIGDLRASAQRVKASD